MKRYSNKEEEEEDCYLLVTWVPGCYTKFDIPKDICVREFSIKNQN